MRKRFFAGGLVSLMIAGAACGGQQPPVCPCFNEPVSESLEEMTMRLDKRNESCVEVIKGHNDIRQKRINVVFVGVDYIESQFVEKVYEATSCSEENNGLLAVEPYTSNPDALNFWYVPKTAHVKNKQKHKNKDDLSAYKDEAYNLGIKAANSCDLPNKMTFVIVNKKFRSYAYYSSFRYLSLEQMRFQSIGHYQKKYAHLSINECREIVNDECKKGKYHQLCGDLERLRGAQDPARDRYICNIITNGGDIRFGSSLISGKDSDAKYLIGHEGGHGIIGLRDEYENKGNFKVKVETIGEKTYLKILTENPVNCFPAKTKEECEQNAPWKRFIGKEGVGCYQGCGYTKEVAGMPVWRSVEKGMMRSSKTNHLGFYNESRACDVLYMATQNVGGVCEKFGYVKDF